MAMGEYLVEILVLSLETKIEHGPGAQLAISKKPTLNISELRHTAIVWLNGIHSTNSPVTERLWNGSALRACADGGANTLSLLCRDSNFSHPHFISGDFDSISVDAKRFFEASKMTELIETPNQDETDLTKCLRILSQKIKANGIRQIKRAVIFGGLSGRFDHTLATLNTMCNMSEQFDEIPLITIDGKNVVTILPNVSPLETKIEHCPDAQLARFFQGENSLSIDRQLTTGICGIVPFVQRKTIVSTTGFKWNLENAEMAFGGLISTSNQLASEETTVVNSEPVILTLELC